MLIGRGKQLIEPRKNFTIRLSDEEREQANADVIQEYTEGIRLKNSHFCIILPHYRGR